MAQLKIEISYDSESHDENINFIKIKLFSFITVKKIKLKKEKNKHKKRSKVILKMLISIISDFIKGIINYDKKNKFYLSGKDALTLNKKIKYEKLYLDLGINFLDPIINAYMISLINSFINIYMSKNMKKINLNNTYYNTYISKKIYDMKVNIVFKVSLIYIIPVLIKVIFKYFKLKKEINSGVHVKKNT